jgi:feruloyl-CoA synthase
MIKDTRTDMSQALLLIEPEVIIHPLEDGGVVLQNKVSLASYPHNCGSWLHNNAARFPDKPFLLERDADGEWQGITFSETLALVNRLSNGLVALELPPKSPIAILSPNSIKMALLQLAAMQIGQPVVPISYAYLVRSQTGGHIEHILHLTGAQMLVMSNADLYLGKISRKVDQYVYAFSNHESYSGVASFAQLFAPENETTLCSQAQARFAAVTHNTLAKIQFTSGSTGKPKGVMVTHGMMSSNQVATAQMWPFLDRSERTVDWLPWNHTFGGNKVFNMALMHGWSFYIDNGNPTPAGLEKTSQNILDVCPTLYFGVPRSYSALYARMQKDTHLKQAFFKELKFIFTAAAALDQATYEGMKRMSREVRGKAIPFFAGWGCTESAPGATLVYSKVDDALTIGLPIPGVSIKLAPTPGGLRELRIKGPNVTPGYYNDLEATTAAFDQGGYYCTGDAGRLLNPDIPAKGLLFEGRLGENFKLSSGVWVQNATLRASINQLGQPYLLDLVVAAPNHDYLTALIFPNIAALRTRFVSAATSHREDAAFLQSESVLNFFREIFQQHNASQKGSSRRFARFIILTTGPQIDHNETTDKGYINQRAVLTHRADEVAKLYQEPPPSNVVVI